MDNELDSPKEQFDQLNKEIDLTFHTKDYKYRIFTGISEGHQTLESAYKSTVEVSAADSKSSRETELRSRLSDKFSLLASQILYAEATKMIQEANKGLSNRTYHDFNLLDIVQVFSGIVRTSFMCTFKRSPIVEELNIALESVSLGPSALRTHFSVYCTPWSKLEAYFIQCLTEADHFLASIESLHAMNGEYLYEDYMKHCIKLTVQLIKETQIVSYEMERICQQKSQQISEESSRIIFTKFQKTWMESILRMPWLRVEEVSSKVFWMGRTSRLGMEKCHFFRKK
ncbi:hypothetical protein Ciccas_005624 [Cichlidogyrus casuarinus]|uniref:Uncharacterized protein n=1 Tax=Cichlidogyrus casuarinus TaxID=1844966 RepID=A0ABD2QAH8_9PLAT